MRGEIILAVVLDNGDIFLYDLLGEGYKPCPERMDDFFLIERGSILLTGVDMGVSAVVCRMEGCCLFRIRGEEGTSSRRAVREGSSSRNVSSSSSTSESSVFASCKHVDAGLVGGNDGLRGPNRRISLAGGTEDFASEGIPVAGDCGRYSDDMGLSTSFLVDIRDPRFNCSGGPSSYIVSLICLFSRNGGSGLPC